RERGFGWCNGHARILARACLKSSVRCLGRTGTVVAGLFSGESAEDTAAGSERLPDPTQPESAGKFVQDPRLARWSALRGSGDCPANGSNASPARSSDMTDRKDDLTTAVGSSEALRLGDAFRRGASRRDVMRMLMAAGMSAAAAGTVA